MRQKGHGESRAFLYFWRSMVDGHSDKLDPS
jgi:hypothetical protein